MIQLVVQLFKQEFQQLGAADKYFLVYPFFMVYL